MTQPATASHTITVTYQFTLERQVSYPTSEDIEQDNTLAQRMDVETDEYGGAADIVAKAVLNGDGMLEITAVSRPTEAVS